MEFPDLGKHCHEKSCNRLDFLPVKCDACDNIFCSDHMTYASHNCPSTYKKDVQVPICPLCGSPVPTPRNRSPDVTVGAHIDNDCQSDPAKSKRKIKANRCHAPGCKVKEMVPVLCNQCKKNYCLRHRFPDDHKCNGVRSSALLAAEQRQTHTNSSHFRKVQGNMTEDEALAYALAESIKETVQPRPSRVNTVTTSGSNTQQCRLS